MLKPKQVTSFYQTVLAHFQKGEIPFEIGDSILKTIYKCLKVKENIPPFIEGQFANIMATNNNKLSALYWAVMKTALITYLHYQPELGFSIQKSRSATTKLSKLHQKRGMLSFLCRLPKINVEGKNSEGKTPMMVVKDSKAIGFWDKKKFKEVLKDSGAKS